ncbi:MAG TPA: hypothetical protein VMO47_19025 [Rhodothermales bacterium]|nr:hypothetical protein [Rhodothermales bacterium]
MTEESMDRQQQLTKLVNVLHRTARSAREGNDEVVERARHQFNRVRDTLGGLDESVHAVFAPLDEEVSGPVVSAACKELIAYFEDEVGHPDIAFDSDSIREFWRKSAKDLEEFGDFIRESLGQLNKERKKAEESNESSPTNGAS